MENYERVLLWLTFAVTLGLFIGEVANSRTRESREVEKMMVRDYIIALNYRMEKIEATFAKEGIEIVPGKRSKWELPPVEEIGSPTHD